MSIAAMNKVWQSSQAKGTDRLVLIALADHANDSFEAWPSTGSLARKVNMSERNTQYALAKLVQSGELIVNRNAGPKGCNLYRISLATGVQQLAPPVDPKGVQPIAPPNDDQGVQPIASGGANGGEKGVQPIAPESSLNHQEPSSGRAGQSKRKVKGSPPIPENCEVSQSVKAYALKHRHDRIDERWEGFKLYWESSSTIYKSPDATFKRALRESWKCVQLQPQSGFDFALAQLERVEAEQRRVQNADTPEFAARRKADIAAIRARFDSAVPHAARARK